MCDEGRRVRYQFALAKCTDPTATSQQKEINHTIFLPFCQNGRSSLALIPSSIFSVCRAVSGGSLFNYQRKDTEKNYFNPVSGNIFLLSVSLFIFVLARYRLGTTRQQHRYMTVSKERLFH